MPKHVPAYTQGSEKSKASREANLLHQLGPDRYVELTRTIAGTIPVKVPIINQNISAELQQWLDVKNPSPKLLTDVLIDLGTS